MSIEVRQYDGTAQELSRFVVQTWLETYQGKMIVPDWTPEYFDWQMTGPEFAEERQYLITAWDKNELVGTILGMPVPLWVHGEVVPGCQESWLSVSTRHRRMGIASSLAKAMLDKQVELGCFAGVGYTFKKSRLSLGPRFWSPKKTSNDRTRWVSLWARVLNPRPVSEWSHSRAERLLLRYMPQFICGIDAPHSQVIIRDYREEDLPACLDLINQQARRADLAVLWEPHRLKQQLRYGTLAHTLVVERAGQVVGFLNYHLLGLFMRSKISSGVIDLFAQQNLTSVETRSLVNAALKKMQQQGVDLVLMREFFGQPTLDLFRSRFAPQFPDSQLLAMMNPTEQTAHLLKPAIRKIHVLWR